MGDKTFKEFLMESTHCQTPQCAHCHQSECGRCGQEECESCSLCDCNKPGKHNEMVLKRFEAAQKRFDPEFAHTLRQDSIKLAKVNARRQLDVREPIIAAPDEQHCILTRFNGDECDISR